MEQSDFRYHFLRGNYLWFEIQNLHSLLYLYWSNIIYLSYLSHVTSFICVIYVTMWHCHNMSLTILSNLPSPDLWTVTARPSSRGSSLRFQARLEPPAEHLTSQMIREIDRSDREMSGQNSDRLGGELQSEVGVAVAGDITGVAGDEV